MMSLPQVLLDTDILSALMRGNQQVAQKARDYLAQYGQLTFSIITRYEVLRGLKAKGATGQEQNFERFCRKNTVLLLTDDVVSGGTNMRGLIQARRVNRRCGYSDRGFCGCQWTRSCHEQRTALHTYRRAPCGELE
jgi:predicted nucleic acid-binding protein